MNNTREDLFETIRDDRQQGSRELMTRLLEGLLEIGEMPENHRDAEVLCRKIADLRPGMALFGNVAALLAHRHRNENRTAFRSLLVDLLRHHRQSVEGILDQYRRGGFSDASVLVFSRSGTLREVLVGLRPRRIYVPESHPGSEGVSFAETLSETLEVTFLYDLEAGRILAEVDALFLGCDQFGPDGAIHNKVGSHLLTRAAGSTPVRVFTESWKYNPDFTGGPGPTTTSPKSLPSSLKRHHELLEPVPAREIDTLITEQGIGSSDGDDPPVSGELLEARRQFFGE